MNQFELLGYIPSGKNNAISSEELSLLLDIRILCINRQLKKLEKYDFIQYTEHKHNSKKYYK